MSKTITNDSAVDWQKETLEQTRDRIRRRWGDYPLVILIINPINLRLVRRIGHTTITPNQLTVLSFVLTVLAALCLTSIMSAIQAIGGGLILLGFLVDCLDGDLARLKGIKSPLGAMLDPILDRCGELAVILCVAINGWRTTNEPIWLIGGIFLMGISQIYFYLVDAIVWKLPGKKVSDSESSHWTIKGTRVRFGAIEPFVWGQALLAFTGVAYWGVPVFSVMFFLGCLKTIYSLISQARNLKSEMSDHYGTHTR